MHWLRDYEGPRGVSYVIAIVGAVAPTILAMYLLGAKDFNAIDWPKALLLAGSIGAFVTVLCVVAVVLKLLTGAMVQGLESTPALIKSIMTQGLVLGAIFAFATQSVSLLICIDSLYDFRSNVLSCLCGGGVIIAIAFVVSVASWNFSEAGKRHRRANSGRRTDSD